MAMTYRQLIMELDALAMTHAYESRERDILLRASNTITYLLDRGEPCVEKRLHKLSDKC